MTINNLFYDTLGSGKKEIVFLHGFGGSHHCFKALASHLDSNFKSYLLDLPGFGESKLERAFNLNDYAKSINDFIINMKIDNPLIIGHSFGGRIALKMAELYHYKIILISTPIYDYRTLKTRVKLLANKLFKISRPSADYKNVSPLMRQTMNNVFSDMKKISFKNIDGNKVLIIYANNDKVVPKRIAYYGKRKMQGSGLIEIKGNHFAYLKETILLSKVIENYA